MPSYRLSSDAQSDLIEIRRYTLTQWGSSQSKKYLSELRQTIHLLSEAPMLGKQRPDIAAGVFSFPYASHVIYYVLVKHLHKYAHLRKKMLKKNDVERA